MRAFFLFFCFTLTYVSAQVVDRYNFVQRPSLTGTTIAWRTASPSIGTIEWGTDAFNLNNSLSDPTPTTKHAYDIDGLTPNTKYYYQTSTDGGFTSGIDYFYTAKPDSLSDITFLHYGDCGYNNTVQNDIAALMLAEEADFGIVAGDIDQGVGDNYDDVFFGVYEDLLKNSCHFTCIGNHDTYADGAATYLDAFYLPSNNPQQTERYYSFVWGNAKFVCLDSNIPYTTGTDQYNWMIDELRCNDKQWLFVFFHHPPWTNAWSADYYIPFTEYYQYQGNVDMRTHLVPLFEQYGVDYVLNGHSHCYQRGELNGVKYIISGGAGSSTMDFNTNSNSPNIDTEIYVNQYVRFNIKGDTSYYVSVDINGAVVDSVSTVKPWTPIRPSISQNGDDLISTSGTTYTWFLDGIQISGATDSAYTPTQSGVYEVQTTNQYGCTFNSDPFTFTYTEVEEQIISDINVFPNPSNGILNISGNIISSTEKISFDISNMTGQVILQESISNNGTLQHRINLEGIENGIYLLKIKSGEQQFTTTFIVQ